MAKKKNNTELYSEQKMCTHHANLTTGTRQFSLPSWIEINELKMVLSLKLFRNYKENLVDQNRCT